MDNYTCNKCNVLSLYQKIFMSLVGANFQFVGNSSEL